MVLGAVHSVLSTSLKGRQFAIKIVAKICLYKYLKMFEKIGTFSNCACNHMQSRLTSTWYVKAGTIFPCATQVSPVGMIQKIIPFRMILCTPGIDMGLSFDLFFKLIADHKGWKKRILAADCPQSQSFMDFLSSERTVSSVYVFPPKPVWKRSASSWLRNPSTEGSQHKLTVLPNT